MNHTVYEQTREGFSYFVASFRVRAHALAFVERLNRCRRLGESTFYLYDLDTWESAA